MLCSINLQTQEVLVRVQVPVLTTGSTSTGCWFVVGMSRINRPKKLTAILHCLRDYEYRSMANRRAFLSNF
jgi:hypothetical protein